MADIVPVENTGFKGILVTLYQRVILGYKTTLIGMAIVAAGVIIDAMAQSQNKYITIAAGILGSILAFYKEPPKPVVP